MRKRNFYILSVLSCLIGAPALANWQYPGTYVGDGWYEDDGTRFVISARGGASFGFGSIKNQVGALVNPYFYEPETGVIVAPGYCANKNNCEGYELAGYGDLDKISPSKDFKGYAFAAGASIGWTLPYRPQWRIEAGWDHVAKTDYNASPMFDGDLQLYGGAEDVTVSVQSGAVNSTVTTDIISAMAYYDFFDGLQKPIETFIPYIGVGLGYADSKTILNLSDPYGDLSVQYDLYPYGELDENKVLNFYKSETTSSNVAGMLAVGFSYGIAENMFLDFGVRMIYLPRIKWELSNEDGTRHREYFKAENMIYTNAMLGLRFEF